MKRGRHKLNPDYWLTPREIAERLGCHHNLPFKAGYHWFRRRVATTVRKVCGGSDIDAHNFMRWAAPRQFSMLDRYDQTPHEETDMTILDKHPVVKMWEEVIPYLLKLNTSYSQLSQPALYDKT